MTDTQQLPPLDEVLEALHPRPAAALMSEEEYLQRLGWIRMACVFIAKAKRHFRDSDFPTRNRYLEDGYRDMARQAVQADPHPALSPSVLASMDKLLCLYWPIIPDAYSDEELFPESQEGKE